MRLHHVCCQVASDFCVFAVCFCFRAVLVDKHPVGIILKSNALKGIRFQVSKEHWKGTAAYARLPALVVGAFSAWSGSKEDGKVGVDWESDGFNSVEHLSVILRPKLCLKLLPYAAGGKSAPKAKGAQAKRNYATAISTGPYAPQRDDNEEQDEQKHHVCAAAFRTLVQLMYPVSSPRSLYLRSSRSLLTADC